MNPPRLVAVVCLLLVVLAFLGRLLSNPVEEMPGPPTSSAAKIAYLAAQVAPIGDFDREFNVNLENPFVPIHARREEQAAIKEPKVVRTKPLPPPGPPVVIEAPRLVLPRAKPVDVTRPECLGVISHARSGREVLIVRLPGGEEQELERGARIGEWELLDLAPGGARFRDPKGIEQEVPFVAPTPMVMRGTSEPAAVETPPADAGAAPEPAVEQPAANTPPPQPQPAEGNQAPERRRREEAGGRRPPRPQPPQPQPAPEMVPRPPKK